MRALPDPRLLLQDSRWRIYYYSLCSRWVHLSSILSLALPEELKARHILNVEDRDSSLLIHFILCHPFPRPPFPSIRSPFRPHLRILVLRLCFAQNLLLPPGHNPFPVSNLIMSGKDDFYELHQQPVAEPRHSYPYDADQYNGQDDADKDKDGVPTGTNADALDMQRMGRKQELRRNFKSISILGLAAVTMATWISMLMVNVFSLINGGMGGTIWVYFASWMCTLTLVASLAEMASMAPTSGGQYRGS